MVIKMKNKYRINHNYSLILKKNGELLCINKDNKIVKYKVDECEIEHIKSILNSEVFMSYNSRLFNRLCTKGIIIKDKGKNNTNLYLESFTNSKINMESLLNKKVMIIGLGGIGTEIITHLIGSGINNFVILDFDLIDKSNLNRQYLFNKADIGKKKTDVVHKRIIERNNDCIVSNYSIFIKNENDLISILQKEAPDIVICAADNPFLDIRISVLKSCINQNIPCIFGGVSINTGQYGPALITKAKMQKYLNKLINIRDLVQCNNINKASFGPTNSIISACMAIDTIMVLLNKKALIKSLNSIREINFLTRSDYEKSKF